MTFRIDGVSKESEGKWTCDFKGVRGQGRYGRLLTDDTGSGLYLRGQSDELIELLPPEQFHIPAAFPPEWARERFAAALWFIRWGGEIREYGPGQRGR